MHHLTRGSNYRSAAMDYLTALPYTNKYWCDDLGFFSIL